MMTDKELVDALRLCASHGSFCVGCPRRDVAGLSCMNELMLEAADRIAAGKTLRKDDSHKHFEVEDEEAEILYYPDEMHRACSACKTEWFVHAIPAVMRYCPHCGKKFRKDDSHER